MKSASEPVVRSSGSDRVLVIMAKAPKPGAVKTRLAPSLSPAAVTAFYCCLLDDTLALARSLGDVEVAIMCPDTDVNELAQLAVCEVSVVAQKGEGLAAGLTEEKIAAEDRVIRRIALRGSASEGVAVSRADLVPEVTIMADGVYWHPVGAEGADLLVTRDIFPLSESFAAVRRAFDREAEHANKLARIFNCA